MRQKQKTSKYLAIYENTRVRSDMITYFLLLTVVCRHYLQQSLLVFVFYSSEHHHLKSWQIFRFLLDKHLCARALCRWSNARVPSLTPSSSYASHFHSPFLPFFPCLTYLAPLSIIPVWHLSNKHITNPPLSHRLEITVPVGWALNTNN